MVSTKELNGRKVKEATPFAFGFVLSCCDRWFLNLAFSTSIFLVLMRSSHCRTRESVTSPTKSGAITLPSRDESLQKVRHCSQRGKNGSQSADPPSQSKMLDFNPT